MLKKICIAGGCIVAVAGTLYIVESKENNINKTNQSAVLLSNGSVDSNITVYDNSEMLSEYLISEMLIKTTVPVNYLDETKNLVTKDVFIKNINKIEVNKFAERSDKIIISALLNIDSDDFNFDSNKVVQIICSLDNNMLVIDAIDVRPIKDIKFKNESEETSSIKFYESIEEIIFNKIISNSNPRITYLINSESKMSEQQSIVNVSGKIIDKYKRENGNDILLAKINTTTDKNLYFKNKLVDIRYCANNKKLIILELDFSNYE